MSATLRQMTEGEFVTFKECLSTFVSWYRTNCEKIREMADVWRETEDDTLTSILSRGMTSLEQQTEIVKEADRR